MMEDLDLLKKEVLQEWNEYNNRRMNNMAYKKGVKKKVGQKVRQQVAQPHQKAFRLNENEARLVANSLAQDKDVELAERVNIGNAKLNILANLQQVLEGQAPNKTRPEPVAEEDDEEGDEEGVPFDPESEDYEDEDDEDFGGAV